MLWQHLLPHHLLSRLVGSLAKCEAPWLKDRFISWFIKRYQVDMSLAQEPDPKHYANFNAFFTRALQPGLRPIAAGENTIISPADGCISQLGAITAGRIFQAKNHNFSVEELLASTSLAQPFQHGSFATVYLSPKDYHRVHMPFTGRLKQMVYVPGRLFSVNKQSADAIPGLFSRNERVVCLFDTAHGPMAVVLVGAMIVASIATRWAGVIAPSRSARFESYEHLPEPITLQKGEELGHFQLGSTAIVLFPFNVTWQVGLAADSPLVMGQALASWE
jgi:phosphatidylserine decarboxylase